MLVVPPPLLPMLSKRVSEIPDAGNFIYEPKLDGFRILVFKDEGEITIQSRDEKPLNRYFPEAVDALKAALPGKCVLDGEIVIARENGLDFNALQMRIHPAASRVKMLSKEFPTSMVFWDLLCIGDRDLRALPFRERRTELEKVLKDVKPPVHLTPATTDRAVALDWFHRFEGAGLDGVIAKPVNGAYEPNKRAMFKIKHERECDCVVAGFRWHKNGEGTAVGSLLLGIFDDDAHLQHVGVCASFTMEKRKQLVSFLAPYREDALANHPWKEWASLAEDGSQRMPGGKSRWSGGKDLSWQPLRPELVVEVAYDHMQGNRFRHTAQFRRWRADKKPSDCTYAQLEVVAPEELKKLFEKS
ncbi:MAG: ATP-dependent DNA ligase [Polyangiaceae bacterium]